MPLLQDWIHKLEEGAGARYLKIVAFCVAILFLVLMYDFRAYRNFATPEAMDSAQLATQPRGRQGLLPRCSSVRSAFTWCRT